MNKNYFFLKKNFCSLNLKAVPRRNLTPVCFNPFAIVSLLYPQIQLHHYSKHLVPMITSKTDELLTQSVAVAITMVVAVTAGDISAISRNNKRVARIVIISRRTFPSGVNITTYRIL